MKNHNGLGYAPFVPRGAPMWVLLFLIGSFCAAQDPPANQPLTPEVNALVRQLDSDRLSVRETAETRLIELGPEILPLLPAMASRLSPEQRERIARVRQQLQAEFGRRAVEASFVTVQGEMPLTSAMQALEQQTGNRIVGVEPFDQPVSVDGQRVPFWQAFDQLLDQASLTVNPFAGRRGELTVVSRPDRQANRYGRACYRGLFRFEPTTVTAVRDLRNEAVAGLRVRMMIAWEPRITPIALSLSVADILAEDDRGRRIPPDGVPARLNVAVESKIPIVEMEIPLQLPQRDALRIATLHGAVNALIPGRTETFEFSDLKRDADSTQHRAGVTVGLVGIRKNDDVDEFHLQVKFDEASNSLESHRGWILKNEAYVVDTQGRRSEHGGYRVIGQRDDGIAIAYHFALDSPLSEYRFVYATPSLIVRQRVPFTLQKVDLP